MKTKDALCGLAMAVVLQLGVLAGSAQDAYSTNADGSIYTSFNTHVKSGFLNSGSGNTPWCPRQPTPMVNILTQQNCSQKTNENTKTLKGLFLDEVGDMYDAGGRKLLLVMSPSSSVKISAT